MEFSNITLDAEIARQRVAERAAARTTTPKIPATAHRHLLAQRLRRIAEPIDT